MRKLESAICFVSCKRLINGEVLLSDLSDPLDDGGQRAMCLREWKIVGLSDELPHRLHLLYFARHRDEIEFVPGMIEPLRLTLLAECNHEAISHALCMRLQF